MGKHRTAQLHGVSTHTEKKPTTTTTNHSLLFITVMSLVICFKAVLPTLGVLRTAVCVCLCVCSSVYVSVVMFFLPPAFSPCCWKSTRKNDHSVIHSLIHLPDSRRADSHLRESGPQGSVLALWQVPSVKEVCVLALNVLAPALSVCRWRLCVQSVPVVVCEHM